MKDQHDIDIKKLEQQLADLSPSPLTEDLLTRMETAMMSWEKHVPAEEKIVPFGSDTQQVTNKKSYFPIWSAAAAVALMGAVGAVFMSGSEDPVAGPSPALVSNDVAPVATSTEFSHQLTNASNEGITYGADKTPYKVIKIEYIKTITEKGPNGETIKKKVPATEVILLPVDVH